MPLTARRLPRTAGIREGVTRELVRWLPPPGQPGSAFALSDDSRELYPLFQTIVASGEVFEDDEAAKRDALAKLAMLTDPIARPAVVALNRMLDDPCSTPRSWRARSDS